MGDVRSVALVSVGGRQARGDLVMARAQAQGHERPGERGEARAAGLGRGVWEGELTRMWAIAGCGRQGGGRSLG